MLAHQASLFDQDPGRAPAINADALRAAADHRLDEHSWVTHVAGFVVGHHELFDELSNAIHWEQRRRWMFDRMVDEPRLTGECRDLAAAPPFLAEAAATLSESFGVRYDGLWLNWYRDQDDGAGWHADRPANRAPTAVVPVLSLGAPRRFLIRPAGGGRSAVLAPSGGDLLVMRGRCQREWQHCVPKQKAPSGPRMSVNFTSTAQS